MHMSQYHMSSSALTMYLLKGVPTTGEDSALNMKRTHELLAG